MAAWIASSAASSCAPLVLARWVIDLVQAGFSGAMPESVEAERGDGAVHAGWEGGVRRRHVDGAPCDQGCRHLVGVGACQGGRGQGCTGRVAGDRDYQGTAVAVGFAGGAREPLGQPRHGCPCPRRPQERSCERGGDLYRARPPPEPAEAHVDAVQFWEGFRQSEVLRSADSQSRAAHTGVAEGADTLAGALVDQTGGSPGARAAVGERVLGRRAGQRGARAPRGQGESVAQGAPVAQFVTVARTGEEVADLDPGRPLACPGQGERAGEVARYVVVAEGRHDGRSASGRDGIQLEDAPDEGSLPRGVEVVCPRLRRRRDRRDAQLHERADR